MQLIIKGKKYNTDTSRLLYTDSVRMRRYYQSKKGTFYVVYADGTGAIKTEDEIKDLLSRVNTELYFELFGDLEEG